MKLLKFLVFLNLIYSCFCAAVSFEVAFTLTEIDVGTKECSMALVRSGQFADSLKPVDFDATFFLTDGVEKSLLPVELDFSWKPLKGQVRQARLQSEYSWSHLLVVPSIDSASRKILGMPEDSEFFFQYQVTLKKGILSIFPVATMVHSYEDLMVCKTTEPKALSSTYSMIPKMFVTII